MDVINLNSMINHRIELIIILSGDGLSANYLTVVMLVIPYKQQLIGNRIMLI